MYVRYATKGIQIHNALTKLQAENNISLYKRQVKIFLKKKFKKKYYNLNKKMYKARTPFKIRKILNF